MTRSARRLGRAPAGARHLPRVAARRRARWRCRLVLPGHGDPITDHRALIDERFALHERRAAKIHRLIAERPRTAYELAQALWGNIAVTQAYLTLSEVLGHVDLLEAGRSRPGSRARAAERVRGRLARADGGRRALARRVVTRPVAQPLGFSKAGPAVLTAPVEDEQAATTVVARLDGAVAVVAAGHSTSTRIRPPRSFGNSAEDGPSA